MKNKLFTRVTCLCVLFSLLSTVKVARAYSDYSLVFEVRIDGRSLLYIDDNTMQWNHLNFDKPGQHGGITPMYISFYENSITKYNNYEWYTSWTGNLSDPLHLQDFVSPEDGNFSFKSITSRESLTVLQLPSAFNSYQTIIDFNDNNTGGSAWYKFQLDYSANSPVASTPEPGTILLMGIGLAGSAFIKRRMNKARL